MKKSPNSLLICIATGLSAMVLALVGFSLWRDVAPASTPSSQTATKAMLVLENNSKMDDTLVEDAFAGTQKPMTDEDNSNLRVGEVPLSKFHAAAAKEFELGNRLAEGKKWSEAHSHYIKCMNEIHKDQRTRVVILDGNWFSVCYGVIALCLAEQNQFEAAVNHLDEALRLDAGIKENFVLRGNLYKRLHKNTEAKADFRIASGKSVLPCYPEWAQKSQWCNIPAASGQRSQY